MISRTKQDGKMSNDKWNDPVYHSLECMRELSAAEIHLVQYINQKEKNERLEKLLESIRNFRKKLEESTLG